MTRRLSFCRNWESVIAILSVTSVELCLLLTGCDIEDEPPEIQGVYKGTYSRTEYFATDSVSTREGPATFKFTGTDYSCYGEEFYLPPGGAGEYTISDSKIILIDLVGHTAEFDWSLILNGEFDYSFDGKNLILTQHDTKRGRFHRATLIKEGRNIQGR